MSPESLLTFSQIGIFVGMTLTGVGTFAAHVFGKRLAKARLVTFSHFVALVGVVLTGAGGFGAYRYSKRAQEAARPPLSVAEIESVRAQGLSYAARIRTVPMAASVYEPELRPLAQKLWADERYDKTVPLETALIYRMYAATLLFLRPPSGGIIEQVSDALPWLTRSVALIERSPKKPADFADLAAAHRFFTDVAAGKVASVDARTMFRHQFRVAMPEASANAVDDSVDASVKLLTQLVAPGEHGNGSAKDDYKFFEAYRVGGFTLGQVMKAFQVELRARFPEKQVGGDPMFAPLPNGNTKVMFRFEGAVVGVYEWEVSKKRQLVVPLNDEAKELMQMLAAARQ